MNEVRDLHFPGFKPSVKLLRATAKAHQLGRQWGKAWVVTAREAECLSLLGSEGVSGMRGARSQCAKRTVRSRKSELKKQLERSLELEQFGLAKTSGTTTENKPTGQKIRLVHPSPTRP